MDKKHKELIEEEYFKALEEVGRHYQRAKALEKALAGLGSAVHYNLEIRDRILSAMN